MTSPIFLACETTGMWRFKAEPDDPAQPHLLRVASLIEGDAVPRVDIIWPDPSWSFEDGAVRLHGISRDVATERGAMLDEVLRRLTGPLAECPALILFSADFWGRVLRKSWRDAGITYPEPVLVVDAHKAAQRVMHRNAPHSFEDCYEFFTRKPLRLGSDPIQAGARKVLALQAIWQGVQRAEQW